MVGGAWYMYLAGKNACEVKILKETIVVKDKMNEVRNNRPDDAALFDSLRSGTF